MLSQRLYCLSVPEANGNSGNFSHFKLYPAIDAIKRAQLTRLSSIPIYELRVYVIIDQSAFIYRNPKSRHYYTCYKTKEKR